MAEKKQVRITGAIEKDEGEPLKTDKKSDILLNEDAIDATRKRYKSSIFGGGSTLFLKKDKKEDKIKTFKDFMQDEIKPFKLLSLHIPSYQDHYQYPGYIPFNKRELSESLLQSGWDEKQDNDRIRRQLIFERTKRKKRFIRPGIKIRRNAVKEVPLHLTDPWVLGEMFVRKLSGKNPRYPQPLYQWNYYHGEYREMVKPCDDHEDIIRQSAGLIHVDSQEARWQIEDETTPFEIESESSTEVGDEEGEEEEDVDEDKKKPTEEEEEEEEEEDEAEAEAEEAEDEDEEEGEEEHELTEDKEGQKKEEENEDREETPLEILEKLKFLEDEPPIRYRKSRKLFNLFNFTDRGIQGEVTLTGEKTTQTIPVPMERLNKYITHYIVYDVYQKDMAEKEAALRLQKLIELEGEPPEPTEDEQVGCDEDATNEEESILKSYNKESIFHAKLLERMVVQNTLYDYTADMKFYEDPIDDFNKEEGSLLPLWTFKRGEFEGLSVTCIQFCPTKPDVFGVTHGSFDYIHKPQQGFVSVYSIKDPTNPEYKRQCHEGVTCFAYHPGLESYIAYALYDGSIHCCDTRDPPEGPDLGLHSHPEEGHQSLIWSILWDKSIEEFMFYTISADCMFYKWNVRNSVIVRSIAMTLYYPPNKNIPMLQCPFPFIKEISEPTPVTAMATTLEIDPNSIENVFVGTSDGMVLKCCLGFASAYLAVYHSHTLPVNRIHFNHFLKHLFITSSEDRRVNIHEEGREKPLYTLVQNTGVVDVQWAPHSSTVFALLTSDCQVKVYDLNISPHKPICKQYILWQYGKITLTKLSFHPTRPIVLVGDSSGKIVSFKLSPNLRMKPKKQKRQKVMEPLLMEMSKIETCLNYIREPDEYPIPKDDPKNLVAVESESDEEETVRIGGVVHTVLIDDDKDASRRVKRRVFEKYSTAGKHKCKAIK